MTKKSQSSNLGRRSKEKVPSASGIENGPKTAEICLVPFESRVTKKVASANQIKYGIGDMPT